MSHGQAAEPRGEQGCGQWIPTMRKSTPKATSVAMTHGGVYTSCLTGILCCSPIFCARRRSNSIPAMPQWREHARARLQTCEHARGRKDTHAVIIHTGLGPLRLRGSSSFAIAPAQQDEPATLRDAWGDGRGLSPECPPDGRHRDASILNALRPTFDHFPPTRVASLAATLLSRRPKHRRWIRSR